MLKILCEDGVTREDTPAQAAIRKTKPRAQAEPARFWFNGLPYAKADRKRKSNASPEKQVEAGFLGAVRAVGRRNIQELRRTVHARNPRTMEFVHSNSARRAAQRSLDMLEALRERPPHVDVDLVAYLLELHGKSPQLFGAFMAKELSLAQDNAPRDFLKPSTFEEVIESYEHFGIPLPDWLKAKQKKMAEDGESSKAATFPGIG
jgi:hypothetical protein